MRHILHNADEAVVILARINLTVRNGEMNGEGGFVSPFGNNHSAAAHDATLAGMEIALDVVVVILSGSSWHQQFDVVAEHLLLAVTEQLFGCFIEENDVASLVDDNATIYKIFKKDGLVCIIGEFH